MKKINPLLYVADHSPVPEAVLNASGWFETETMNVTIGHSVGEPRKGLPESALAWFIADGWTAKLLNTTTKLPSWSTSPSKSDDVISYSSWSTYQLRRRKMQSERVLNDMLREFTEAYNEGREVNSARYEEILLVYNASLDNTESFLTALEAGLDTTEAFTELMLDPIAGDYATYKASALSKLTLHDTDIAELDSYVAELESYQAEVSTFMTDLNSTATGLAESSSDLAVLVASLASSATALGEFAAELIEAKTSLSADVAADLAAFDVATEGLKDGLSKFETDSESLLTGYGESLRTQINTRFDAQIATQKQSLISKGLYNATVWNSIASGIERERSLALTDVEDKITQQNVGITTGAYDRRARIRGAELDAKAKRATLTDNLHARLFSFRDQKLRVHDQGLRVGAQGLTLHDQALKINDQGMRLNSQKLRVHDQRLKMVEEKLRVRNDVMAARLRSIATLGSIYDGNSTFRLKALEAKGRLNSQITDGKLNIIQARNSILNSMVGFMERRSDEYPGLDSLAGIAAQLGYGESGSVSPGGAK